MNRLFFVSFNNHFYDSLQLSAQKKESGELSILFNYLELPLKYAQWMDIYAYHLEHPNLSQFQLALEMDCGKSTIQRALSAMEQPLT